MTSFLADARGSMALVTVLLLPTVLIVLVGVLELGAVRVVAERARIAADLAAIVAVNDQDEAELVLTGSLRPARDAETVARQYLALNLAPLSASLAATPDEIAAAADVAVFNDASAIDPRTGRSYGAPTVRIAADLPVLTPAFGPILARPVTVVHLFAASSAR